ncbi:DUF445 domain-containing protein [Sphingobacteriales bacterium UPWRP_1]|nr:hypothetical protein B6N25_02470 [Sphingobacteriales bacterium TSM_CSS]PSJ75926.1 DUF445 domain-containing protein [Sphingobacteriales bacterium UPWRP_1]
MSEEPFSTPTPESLKKAKQQRLFRMQVLATGLLVFMGVVFLITKSMEVQHVWLRYVRIFAEAAMIGALADWFAVTALFRHPLGLPIPHTNLIVGNQDKIGQNLGYFVTNNFLAEHTMEQRINELNISTGIAEWLKKNTNTDAITAQILRLVPEALNNVNEEQANIFLQDRIAHFVQQADFNGLLSDLVKYLTAQGQHQWLMDQGVVAVRDYLQKPAVRKWMDKEIRNQLPKVLPGFVDNYIVTHIFNSIEQLLAEIEKNPNHRLRLELNEALRAFAVELRHASTYKDKIEAIKTDLLKSDLIWEQTGNLWQQIKQEILKNIENPHSLIRREIDKSLSDAGDRILKSQEARDNLDKWLRKELFTLFKANRDWISRHISQTVSNWDKREISDKLELEVGKDLQYIRINGTLVGGTVGLLMHLILDWLM